MKFYWLWQNEYYIVQSHYKKIIATTEVAALINWNIKKLWRVFLSRNLPVEKNFDVKKKISVKKNWMMEKEQQNWTVSISK